MVGTSLELIFPRIANNASSLELTSSEPLFY